MQEVAYSSPLSVKERAKTSEEQSRWLEHLRWLGINVEEPESMDK